MKLSPKIAFRLFLVSTLVIPFAKADELPGLKYFNVTGTQYQLLAKSFWERLQFSGAGMASCVRRFYSKKELMDHPLIGDAYGVLKFFKKTMTAENQNTFAFLNSRGEPWKCSIIGGYCMGMSALERDLNLLLIFDPNESFVKVPAFANDQAKSEFYEELLFNAWKEKKPVFIPGFSDMNSFSGDEVINNIFMGAVPKNWGDLATIPEIALGVLSKSRKLVKEPEMLEQIQNLIQANEKGYNPLLYLGGVEKPAPSAGRNIRSLRLESVPPPPHDFNRAPSEAEVRAAMAAADPKLKAHGMVARSIPGAISGAIDADHTYIHVVQVTDFTKVSERKYTFNTIDPNGYAPNNIGKLTVDLDAKPPIYWEGASASLDLNSFGQLPGDREHMDEIVANLNIFAKENPGVFSEPPLKPKKPKKKPGGPKKPGPLIPNSNAARN